MSSKRSSKYRRAKLRHLLFTIGPDRLTGGRLLERHHAAGIATRRLEIECPRWPRAFDGIRIAHISDFHVGDLLPMEKAMAVVEELAHERPDMICNTGDVIDLDCIDVGPLFRSLQAIEPPLGNYLVLGNHDELDDPDRLRSLATTSGITVLDDSTTRILHNGGELVVGGIQWARTPEACRHRLDRTVGADGVDLLLAHNPKAFDHAAELGVPLVLSGHTHGGQIARKDRPDANLALAHRRSAGLYEHGDSRLFVTVGVGAWFPIRLNCQAEVVILTVRSAARD